MIGLQDLYLHRGTQPLLEGASVTLHAGKRAGIVGPNGCGKSSLFAVLTGELEPDAGEIRLPPHWRIAQVRQEIDALERPAIEFVLDGDTPLREIETALETAEGTEVGELHARLEAIGGHQARPRAARALAGLGFADADLARPVSDFSGGWRMRLNLARALLSRADLLLLDEPTNHLDLDAVLWLEGWLRDYPGTLLLISHDREFLDAVVDQVVHVDGRQLTVFSGNYTAFERQRAARLEQQQADHERQQKEIARIQGFVDRFRAKAHKARQAQSRLKALERMETIAPVRAASPFNFAFPDPPAAPNPLLKIEEASAGFDERVVLDDIDLSLRPDQRIGLLGPNGAGKSTLVRLIAGAQAPLSGSREAPPGLRIGYFAQHQLEHLDGRRSPFDHLRDLAPGADEQAVRDFLGGFDFRGDDVFDPVAQFSGGQRARLSLALIVWQRPNLLLLDEPTNHLDLEMREALAEALQGFEGCLVLVSHDRYLIDSCTDELILVDGGRVAPFAGDLEDYRRHLAERRRGQVAGEARPKRGIDRRAERQRAAQQRRRLAPLRRELEKAERAVERLQAEKQAIEADMADPGLYEAANRAELDRLLAREAEIGARLEAAEAEWMAAGERLEQAEACSS